MNSITNVSNEVFTQNDQSQQQLTLTTGPNGIIQVAPSSSSMNQSILSAQQPLMMQTISSPSLQLPTTSNGMQQILMPSQQLILQQPQNGSMLQTVDGQTILCPTISGDGSNLVQSQLIQIPSNALINNGQIGTNQANPQAGGYFVIMPNANGNGSAIQRFPVVPSVEAEEEPLYVNAKQYHRIMKRRLDRAKLEQQGRIPKERRKYLHESRHRHAMNRVRGEGGRFHTHPNEENSNEPNQEQS